MNHHPSAWGHVVSPQHTFDMYNSTPIAGSYASHSGARDHSSHEDFYAAQGNGINEHTQQPLVTGTSVLGIQYADGVMLAADNLASYGSLARFKDIQRLYPLGTVIAPTTEQKQPEDSTTGEQSEKAPRVTPSSQTCLAVAGDMSDFQYLGKMLEGVLTKERAQATNDSQPVLAPEQIYEYLSNVMYARRSKMNPLWNAIVLGGVEGGKSFLGYVDLLGTTYQAPTLATGFGSHFAQPLLREAYEARQEKGKEDKSAGSLLSREEAEKVMDECMKVLFYRDARSLNKYQIATITSAGIEISESKSNETNWMFAEGLRGYGAQRS